MAAESILETPRLLLREMTRHDIDFVYELVSNPEVMRYWPKCYSREEAGDWIERQITRYEKDGHGYWLAAGRADMQPVGQVGLLMCEVDGVTEPALAYMIHRPLWRKGYAFEASAACVDFAFVSLNYGHLISLIRPENTPSVSLAQKLGFKSVGRTLFAEFIHLVFYISKEDWILKKPKFAPYLHLEP